MRKTEDHAEVDATFHLRRYYRNLGIGGAFGFLAWGALAVCFALTDPHVKHRLAAAALMGGIPLIMCGLSVWTHHNP